MTEFLEQERGRSAYRVKGLANLNIAARVVICWRTDRCIRKSIPSFPNATHIE